MKKNVLQESDGEWSATRLALLVWLAWVLFVWVLVSIRKEALQEIPPSVNVLIGILAGGKVAQKFGEVWLAARRLSHDPGATPRK